MSDLYTLHPSQIMMYSTPWCGDCRRARRVFADAQVSYQEVHIDEDPQAVAFVQLINRGNRSVPTIVFPDGSTMTEPSNAALAEKLATYSQ